MGDLRRDMKAAVERWTCRPARFVPLLAILCLALAAVAALVVWPRFDGLYGQDAFAYWEYTSGALDGALRRGEPPPPFFWPPGFPLAVWLVTIVVGPSPVAGQVVALLGGALVPIFTALLAWELFVAPPASLVQGRVGSAPTTSNEMPAATRFTPLLAGCLVAFHGQLWQSSVVVMSDTAALAAGTAGVWLVARWGRTARTPPLLAAAGLLAFAVLTRWAYALVAVPITIFALHRLAVAAGLGRVGAGKPVRAMGQALGAATMVGAVLSPVWVPAAFGPDTGGIAFTGNFDVYGWSPLNAVRRTFVTADGLLRHRLPNGLYYVLTPAHPYSFTPLLAAFLLPGAWRLWSIRNASRGWLLAGWVGVVLAFHAGAAYQNFRFTLACLPPLAIVAALGIATVRGWIAAIPRTGRRRVASVALAGCVVIGLGAMARGGIELTRFFVQRKNADLATVEWVERRTPSDSRVLAFDLFSTLRHYGRRESRHLYFETPPSIAGRVGRPLLETESFFVQWAGHPSWEAVRQLENRAALVELGRHRGYVLYRIDATRVVGAGSGSQASGRERAPEGSKASSRP